MRKKVIGVIGLILCIILTVGCEKNYSDETLKEHGKEIMNISYSNKSCVPVRLSFYDDGVYELFTEYETCDPESKDCNAVLKYIKSVHGKYDYDVKKIIENARKEPEFSPDNSPIIEIYPKEGYDGDGYYYTINQNDDKKDLDEVLKQINVNLDECAKANYIR